MTASGAILSAEARMLEPAELASLVEAHQAGLWRYLRYLGCAGPEAEDLVQETFLSVLREPLEVRSPEATAGYLRTVARRKFLMAQRRAGRAPTSSHLAAAELEAAEEAWAALAGDSGLEDYLAALADCLTEAIDDRKRAALDLAYREGASREEIAARLALTPDGVKTILRRARAALRECVERKVSAANRQPP